MKLIVVSRDFTLTDSISHHVEEKLSSLLAWNRRKLQRVEVTLGNLNGPRGGLDKYCHVTVDLVSGHTVRIEQVDADLYHAITKCVRRLERNVLDEISRERRRERGLGLGRLWG